MNDYRYIPDNESEGGDLGLNKSMASAGRMRLTIGIALKMQMGGVSGTGWWAHSHYAKKIGRVHWCGHDSNQNSIFLLK